MSHEETENLYLKSLDQPLSDFERQLLTNAIQGNAGFAEEIERYKEMRESLTRQQPATFGPYFAQKVISRIQGMREEIDNSIAYFFKKYQLPAFGFLIALVVGNMFFTPTDFSDSADVTTEDSSFVESSNDDELLSFDFFENFNE
ncbi:MAG: hypothetical protein HOP08_18210 [Cyclobacteriaceae bacterium]|nr:hypothetical protein [Cyclobacteriaceae bacterium]